MNIKEEEGEKVTGLTVSLVNDAKAPYSPERVVRVCIDAPRIKGDVEISPMSTLDYVRVCGDLIVNGAPVHINATPNINEPGIAQYELTRDGWISNPVSAAAKTRVQEWLPAIVNAALALDEFKHDQRQTAIKHLGYDLDRNAHERESKRQELAALELSAKEMQELLSTYEDLNYEREVE